MEQSKRSVWVLPSSILTLILGVFSVSLWVASSWRTAVRLVFLGAMLSIVFIWVAIGVLMYVTARNALDARRSRHRTARDWRERHPTALDEFLADCGVSSDQPELKTKVAVVARNVLADFGGGLPPETIRAEDSLAEPIWDNLWWSDIYFEIEIGAWVKIKDWRVVDGLEVSLHRSQLKVRDLVRAVATGAKPLDWPRNIGQPSGKSHLRGN